jgi:hypothetical protein
VLATSSTVPVSFSSGRGDRGQCDRTYAFGHLPYVVGIISYIRKLCIPEYFCAFILFGGDGGRHIWVNQCPRTDSLSEDAAPYNSEQRPLGWDNSFESGILAPSMHMNGAASTLLWPGNISEDRGTSFLFVLNKSRQAIYTRSYVLPARLSW